MINKTQLFTSLLTILNTYIGRFDARTLMDAVKSLDMWLHQNDNTESDSLVVTNKIIGIMESSGVRPDWSLFQDIMNMVDRMVNQKYDVYIQDKPSRKSQVAAFAAAHGNLNMTRSEVMAEMDSIGGCGYREMLILNGVSKSVVEMMRAEFSKEDFVQYRVREQ